MCWNAICKVFIATGKWGGRLTALLLLLFWGAFFVEHLSEWFLRGDGRYPPAWVWVHELFHFVMLAGLAMMLKWEKSGAVVMIIGMVAFFASVGFQAFPWIAVMNLAPVGCFGVAWLAKGKLAASRVDAPGSSTSRTIALAVLAVVVLLFANELLGNPPLLARTFEPPSALVGTWQAKVLAWPGPSEIEVHLTVHGDGAVSGEIGGATLGRARISGNRTWLGRLLRWRTDYLIQGELSGEARAAPLRNGDCFIAPLNLEGGNLAGSIFTSGRDAAGQRVRSAPLVSRIRLRKM